MLNPAIKRSKALVGVAAVIASASTFISTPARADDLSGPYVALGDSYASGAGVPDQSAGLCLRSDHNYGSLVAAALRTQSYTDVTCAAAKIQDMTSSQYDATFFKVNDPQLQAVNSDTRLVTIGIGGNDLGTSTLGIGDVIATCIAGAAVNPLGTPCKDHYAHGYWNWRDLAWEWGDDTLADRINTAAPRLAAVLQQIHSQAPNARVLVVGYPSVLPDDKWDCLGRQPVTVGDIAYLHDRLDQLNSMLSDTAAANGATYVDTQTPTQGHDICSNDRWIEGAIPGSPAVPFHPNATGEQAMASAILSALGS